MARHRLRASTVLGRSVVNGSMRVEQFGTERVSRLTRPEIDERFELLRLMTAL